MLLLGGQEDSRAFAFKGNTREGFMGWEWWFAAAVWMFQGFGILAVILARLSATGWRPVPCERICFGFVVILAVATVSAIAVSSHHWISLATSLSVVSIGATMHVRPE